MANSQPIPTASSHDELTPDQIRRAIREIDASEVRDAVEVREESARHRARTPTESARPLTAATIDPTPIALALGSFLGSIFASAPRTSPWTEHASVAAGAAVVSLAALERRIERFERASIEFDRLREEVAQLRDELEQVRAGAMLPPVVAQPDEARWTAYFAELDREHGLAPSHAARVRNVWGAILVAIGPDVPLPIAIHTDDGAVQFAWNTPERYLDIETHPDGTYEWFFRDRATDAFDGTEDERETSIPPSWFEHLREFVAAR